MASINPELAPSQPVKGQLGLVSSKFKSQENFFFAKDWRLTRVAEWIGTQVDYDPAKILLWKSNIYKIFSSKHEFF